MIKNEPPVQPPQNPLMVLKGLLLVLSMFLGAFGVFFFIWKQNFGASGSCLVLEIVSVLLLHLNAAVLKGKLHERYNLQRLKFIFIIAVVIGVAEFVGALSYAALGAMNKQGFQLEGYGYYVAVIPSSLASLWAFLLAYESRSYMPEFSIQATNMARF